MTYDARAEGRLLGRMRDHINKRPYNDQWTAEWDELLREANGHAARRHQDPDLSAV